MSKAERSRSGSLPLILSILVWLVTAGAVGVLVFASNIILSSFWPQVWMNWVLLILAAMLIGALPSPGSQSAVVVILYATSFWVLWLQSNDPNYYSRPVLAAYSILLRGLPFLLLVLACTSIWLFVRSRQRARRTLSALFVCLAFGLLVAYFSGGAGGADWMIRWLLSRGFSAEAAETGVFWFRKAVHFGFYGFFSLLALRAAATALPWRASVAWAGAMAGVHAFYDEFRQASVASRTSSPWDFALDCSGIAIFLLLASVIRNADLAKHRI